MKPIISAKNLGKRYTIRHQADGAPTNFREVLTSLPKRIFRGGKSSLRSEFWALRDVNFDIMPGDRVGIIGRNGAGKSTLLKLLSRITEPTTGHVVMRGRVASLLEVGTGFHPELSGRENIFLNGAILGMGKNEIQKKFDEIVDFAGVENFLDTPVKRYSSGMYVRLGFAIAAHLEPEILVVDEVLAVGDVAFQKKCLGKMKEVSKGEGRTVLFVSHNMPMVNSLCQKGFFLNNGAIEYSGSTNDAITMYYGAAGGVGSSALYTPGVNERIGDDIVQCVDAAIENVSSQATSNIEITEPCAVRLTFKVLRNERALTPTLHVYRGDGSAAFSVFHPPTRFEEGLHSLLCHIPGNFLNDGAYSVSIAVLSFEPFSMAHFQVESALYFTITDLPEGSPTRGGYPRAINGAVRPLLQWTQRAS